MATTSRSHRPTACLTTSRWPLVTGSKEPGYRAIRGIAPSTPPRPTPQADLVPHDFVPGRSAARRFFSGVVRCRAGAVTNTGVWCGPGSAERHETAMLRIALESRTPAGTHLGVPHVRPPG